jgi:small subunit ribosomal protein S13
MEERHMARIAGVDLPRDKRVEIGLTYIYGIGRTSADRILKDAGVNPDTRVRDLTSEEVKKISAVIDETQVVEGDLRDPAEHQETERNRMLPWNPSQKRTSGTWSEDKD